MSEFHYIKDIRILTFLLKFWNNQNKIKKENFTYCDWKSPHSINFTVAKVMKKYIKHHDRYQIVLKTHLFSKNILLF